MKQSDLVKAISQDSSLPQTQVEAVLKSLGVVAQQALTIGDDVTLPGLGRIRTVLSKARTGRNPRTGEALQIPEKTRVTFVVSKALKDAVA